MRDTKTTILGILTLVITIAAAAKSVLTGGIAAVDFGTLVQTVTGVLVSVGLIKAADSQK